MKIRFNILSLFLLCALLVSCGTSRQGGKKQRKGMKTQVVLTPEQQRKYDYFFPLEIQLALVQVHKAR